MAVVAGSGCSGSGRARSDSRQQPGGTATAGRAGDGDCDCERRHGRPRVASRGGVADDRIFPARQRREECSEASSACRRAASGSVGRHGARRRSRRRWRLAWCEEAWSTVGGQAWRDEARPTVDKAGQAR
uniref:Uncharacterized protein n=1 Tax=Oryza nivara TaxID=4536 RepID=A0A0E0GR52_ORYNI